MLLAQQGDIEKARSHLRTIVPVNIAQRKQMYLTESSLLFLDDQKERALEILSKAVKLMPRDMELRYVRSMLAIQIGRIDVAEKDLLKILNKTPENPFILNALGYTLADQTDRYEEALGYIEQALKLLPNNPHFLDSLGWVHYRMGNYPEALHYLREAYKHDNNSDVAVHLGTVMWMSGDKKGAVKLWKNSLDNNPNNAILEKVIEEYPL